MVYNPITNMFYSDPQSLDINQSEYILLFVACAEIEANIKFHNDGKYPKKKDLLKQVSIFLKKVGTPTALRLLSDLSKDKVFYPDGSVMRNLFS